MSHILIEIESSNFLYTSNRHKDVTLKDHVISQIQYSLDRLNKQKEQIDTLILTSWCEEYPNSSLEIIQQSIDIIKEKFQFNIVLLLGQQYKRIRYKFPEYKIIEFKNADVYYVRAFPFRLYVKIFEHKMCEPRDKYEKLTENKFLLLIGKPDRVHRVRLLYKLYKKGLLKYALWRFKIHNEYVRNECRQLLHDITYEEFNKFVEDCERELDNIQMDYYPDSSHYPGIPFERWVWDHTMFQVVPETDFYDNFTSEKTWLSIINKSPFIMLAQIHHNKELRDLGFKTFEKYLLHQEYNDFAIGDAEARLDQIIQNIEYWVNNIDKFYEEIKEDAEHNFRVFMNIINEDKIVLNRIIDKYKLDCKPEDLIKGYYV
jgi:hypothetical protein